jgi:hypothetical protein
MNAADFNELSESEKRHFYKCEQCGEMVDMRQLDDVLFHENHVHGRTFNTAARKESKTSAYVFNCRTADDPAMMSSWYLDVPTAVG